MNLLMLDEDFILDLLDSRNKLLHSFPVFTESCFETICIVKAFLTSKDSLEK